MIDLILNFILFTGLFYFVYIALFRNKSFFNINRGLLLFIPLSSLFIPLVAPYFNDPIYESTGFSTILLPEIIVNGVADAAITENTGPSAIYMTIYLVGLFVSATLFFRGLVKIIGIVKSSQEHNWNEFKFSLSNKAESPFSFFSHIILPKGLENDQKLATILIHEKVHQEEKHSYDNLYYNLLSIVFWFNPFIHFLSKELRQTHECIADKKAIENTSREVYAHMLLSSTFGSEVALPANPFFNPSLLKTRITMLYKNESPKWLRIGYLAILPLAAAMTLHACNKAPEAAEAANIVKSQPVDISEIESFPLFDNCDANASKDDQAKCFQFGIRDFIIANLEYPKEAFDLGIEGMVFISFIIDENGKTSKAKVKRGITVPEGASSEYKNAIASMQDKAITLVQSFPDLKPATVNGKSVAFEFTLPISFKLPKDVE